ncbi:hypothetical protein C475_08872 [Halosimplex carlsbadense 2-9-1]|uniref:Uncharacterized protein n=1 Tax=Halosimplex carlsbadense 2-9-1 TaxID=797114 RepID=M0CTK6_9EURY|nr:hypothetical protein [Halosimplex carlsbadense]ELZ26526.1 hypothetical protein C475_08872 [Halosimplex carlsbadense 2-9-1]
MTGGPDPDPDATAEQHADAEQSPVAGEFDDPSEHIPQYILDGLDRQDVRSLEAIIQYSRERIEELQAEINEEELADDDEEVVDVDVEASPGWTRVVKKVPCGKDCGGCPHGPYVYMVKRTGDGLTWDYRGRADER